MTRSKFSRTAVASALVACLLASVPANVVASSDLTTLVRSSDASFHSVDSAAQDASFPSSPFAVRSKPHKRTYDTHHYYALELDPRHGVSPEAAADALGAELVDRAGELKNHYLIRSRKLLSISEKASSRVLARGAVDEYESEEMRDMRQKRGEQGDPVLGRWEALRRRSESSSSSSLLSRLLPHAFHRRSDGQHDPVLLSRSIVGVERQHLRLRAKRSMGLPEEHLERSDAHLDFASYYLNATSPSFDPRAPPPIPGSSVETSAMVSTKFGIFDPIFPEQWHLVNDDIPDNALNVSGVWAQGVTGKGVNVALIDDGVDHESGDLKDNFFFDGSYDFNDHVELPSPRLSDDQHGTRCAGEIAAVKNDVCGVGVAYGAHVSGLRILSGPISDVDEAAALNYRMEKNHIYSCSWGPPDDGRSMDAPKGLIRKAFLNGIQNGRDGKGSIYVFAGGNGGGQGDQCNFDGYTNSIYTVTVAAVDRKGLHPYYSEMCSANMVAAWSSGSRDHIHTTDVRRNGVDRCTDHHGGTSAAAPLAAGVFALVLEVRPDLTWRDLQHVVINSAQPVAIGDKDWQKTASGLAYNHKYGFGKLDAYATVEAARTHKLVKDQSWLISPKMNQPVSQQVITPHGVEAKFSITRDMMKEANLEKLEHITVQVWIEHNRRGDVGVELHSPNGIKSVLARPRRYDAAKTGFPGWTFMTLKHWAEDPVGEWTLVVLDRDNPESMGKFTAWRMTLFGESIDEKKATTWDDGLFNSSDLTHDWGHPTPTTTQHSKPTAHLPGDHGTAAGEDHEDFTNHRPSSTPNPEADTGYLKGLKKNQTWLFVGFAAVIVFAGSVGAFFWMRRSRRKASERAGDYEFVPGEDDVAMSALEGGSKSGGRGAPKQKRTKELYDAFGEGSEEEEPMTREGRGDEYDERFALEDEDEPLTSTTEQYRDHPERESEGEGEGHVDAGGEGGGSKEGHGRSGSDEEASGTGSWADGAVDSPERAERGA